MTARRFSLVLTILMVLGFAASADAASIWTPLNSGTSDTISSIVYQSPTRFWYATTNGKIEYNNGATFVAGAGITPGENFTDLAFAPGGAYGYAVTSTGHVWQSANGGVSWAQLPPPNTRADCAAGAAGPETELNAVVWASSSVVYLLGNGSTLEKSTSAASPSPGFTEINKVSSGTCAAQSDTSSQNLTDATFLAGNPLDGFMISQDFGALYQTSNAFSSGIKKSEMVNNFQGNPRLAQDPANPNRLWAVDHAPGGGGCGDLCLQFSTDGGVTHTPAMFPNASSPLVGLYDITSQGGTEVTAGSGGEIFNSIDGSNFYLQPADGALATENWRAADAYDAAHAAVGGENGALAVTAQANEIPDIIAPTGTISGPTSANSGTPVTYTASVADNAGGSGINPAGYTWVVPGFPVQHGASASYVFPRGTGSAPITLTFADNAGNHATTTLNVTVNDLPLPLPHPVSPPSGSGPTTSQVGGVTITIYNIVFVVGRSDHYVPLTVSAHHGRKIVVSILSLKGQHQLGSGRLTLRRGGRRNLHVGIPANIKPGKYIIVVRVTSLKNHRLGRPLKHVFAVR